MKVTITTRNNKLPEKLRKNVELRVGLALGRFAERIRTVSVILSPLTPATGPPEKLCRIEVTLRKSITVESAQADTIAAVDHALAHAARRISVTLDSDSSDGIPVKPRRRKPAI